MSRPPNNPKFIKLIDSKLLAGFAVFIAISVLVVLARIIFEPPETTVSSFGQVLLIFIDNLQSIAIATAGIVFLLEIPERKKKEQYEAWQVINIAQGKSGNGGRIQALEALNQDGADLEGSTRACRLVWR